MNLVQPDYDSILQEYLIEDLVKIVDSYLFRDEWLAVMHKIDKRLYVFSNFHMDALFVLDPDESHHSWIIKNNVCMEVKHRDMRIELDYLTHYVRNRPLSAGTIHRLLDEDISIDEPKGWEVVENSWLGPSYKRRVDLFWIPFVIMLLITLYTLSNGSIRMIPFFLGDMDLIGKQKRHGFVAAVRRLYTSRELYRSMWLKRLLVYGVVLLEFAIELAFSPVSPIYIDTPFIIAYYIVAAITFNRSPSCLAVEKWMGGCCPRPLMDMSFLTGS